MFISDCDIIWPANSLVTMCMSTL